MHGVYVHDEEDTCVIGGVRAVKDRWEQALHLGAKIASTIRKHVHTELQYTCSAGIAHNKMLAKLGSALKKPNGQTVRYTLSFISLEFHFLCLDHSSSCRSKFVVSITSNVHQWTGRKIREISNDYS